MSRLNAFFLAGFFLFHGAGNAFAPQTPLDVARGGPPAGTPDARGEWLARQMEDRETAKDARVSMRMLVEAGGAAGRAAATAVNAADAASAAGCAAAGSGRKAPSGLAGADGDGAEATLS